MAEAAHARPAAANNGFRRWWQLDFTFVVLVGLGAVGLLGDLQVWRATTGPTERWFSTLPVAESAD